MSCPWVSDPEEVHFPFYSDHLGNCFHVSDFIDSLGFPGGSAVINLPAVQEIWVPSLSQEDALEKEKATHFSILAWEIHGQRSLWATVHGFTKSQTQLSDETTTTLLSK